MATREEVEEAIGHIRDTQGDIGKKGKRMHLEGNVEANTIRYALEHACCGECVHLFIETYPRNGHTQVALRCDKRQSPIGLWRNWNPCDEQPVCGLFSPRDTPIVVFEED